ncbi:hypothetical protein [uncultured Sphingomonas sp.]|uniref:hypothetical protein n=1 Tax=uncultured Sphingomonas sp. TaxID=158754 RepID=UPI0025FC97D7|nr:hypothetical protein [uncultured Sphingomonas sp.]
MTQPTACSANVFTLKQHQELSDPAPNVLVPDASPDAVLATLYALVEAHHALPYQGDAADARAHLDGRMDALRSADKIGATASAVDMEMLVRDALIPFQFGDAEGIVIAGPGVLLEPAAARLLTFVLHELTCNAIKFGALSGGRDQRLRVHWEHTHAGVDVVWQERGVAVLGPAERPQSGFGRKLIEMALASYCPNPPYFRLLPGGVECRITIPEKALIY